ncbi:DegT/DnrJ/EryC1/StrS family aminotransferase [Methylovorus mays]|uniref:DegT/DnrJ/EryC1/StrS family aminotransferase n=1 Tax=Methylovorus mays TaxID=184077 RepID=UPI001E3C4678|nr:aminotransferase class I/II-fold pyridoxal phosphate-dependent enzyme [Methylovorus mays]MCB5208269.1 DegT/DnrJ/EryC1/StrS family aminotransferase [Methylovorus mays]
MQTSSGIPLLTPQLPDRAALQPYLERIDHTRHYSNFGPLVLELESRLASRFSDQGKQPLEVVTVSSATAGLELALTSLDLPPGSRVLVPALTFVASLTAILRAGHLPVICDIDPHSWLLTPDIAEACIASSDAKAIIAVATFGQAQDTLRWQALQQKTGVKVVIDAAAAFGSQWLLTPDIPVVFSMHATKSLAAGEGGFVVTGNSEQRQMIKELSNFGINLNPDTQHPVGHLSYAGTNAKLSEYHAAVGLASLDTWQQQADARQAIYHRYQHLLQSMCGETLVWQHGPLPAAPTTFSVRVGSDARRIKLEQLCAVQGIGTRRWYQPLLHRHAAKVGPILHLPTPVAEAVSSDLIGLPFSPFLQDGQMQEVAANVLAAVSD